MTRIEPLRMPTDDEVEAFWRDGVVVLREVLPAGLVEAMSGPVDGLLTRPEMADMTAMGDALARSGAPVLTDAQPAGEATGGAAGGAAGTGAGEIARRGSFISGVDHWRTDEAFRAFACDGPLPVLVGALLRSRTVRLWEDSVLVKQPGTLEHTAWHQDLSYFHGEGTQMATTWVPLDPATAASGAMRFVRGSHRSGEIFRPNLFVTTMDIPGTEGRAVPDIEELAAQGEVEIIAFDLGPGDVSVHHAATLHAAGANRTERSRRAISVRYCGDDVRYRIRPGAPLKAHHHHVHDGEPLADPDAPLVWSA